MRAAMISVMMLGLTPAFAQSPPDAGHAATELDDARAVSRLNQVILDRDQAVRTKNESEEAAYRAERARYEAALVENGKARAEAIAAQDAFVAASRQHEADMARWRANPAVKSARTTVARPVIGASANTTVSSGYAAARPISLSSGSAQIALDAEASRRAKVVCHTRLDTGSLVKRTRSCGSAESWKRRLEGEQAEARDLVKRNGDGLVQP